jgi:phytoene desaturase
VKKVVVIGSGFAGLSAASFMAKAGWQVEVVEKHDVPGGRARRFSEKGFCFDMGPSWYWMPDVFERYFACFGKKPSDFYKLKRLDPSYKVFWEKAEMDIPANFERLKQLFEDTSPGAGQQLELFLREAAFKYDVGINKLVYKPGRTWAEFMDIDLAKGLLKLDVFTSMKKHIRKYFTHPELIQLLEFPVLFLGALPENIPALYSLMNYADIKLGTWYPLGGMYEVVNGMYKLCLELGVKFSFSCNAVEFIFDRNAVTAVKAIHTSGGVKQEVNIRADVVIGAADYNFIETTLLPTKFRSYSNEYWSSRVMAPSCLLYYVGVDRKLPNISHHSLFFDVNFDKHGEEIYSDPSWPTNPLFYVSATSVTDSSVAPEGMENLFFLIPVAAGLEGDTEELRDEYFMKILKRFEQRTGESISENIVYKRSYAVKDFVDDYNAFKGNAYGLANTLMQTAILKPGIKSKKLKNLFYTGQLTVPGPGVPPSLISGEVVAEEIIKEFKI